MIIITKDESNLIRSVFPDASIARTMKHRSRRHHYYLTEDEKYLRLIAATNPEAKSLTDAIDAKNERLLRIYGYKWGR